MSTPNSNQPENPAATSTKPGQKAAGKQRVVHSANFRSAGRLSNEDARTLTAIHETFAFHLAGALDTYLGTAVEVKLETLDQLPIKEHIADIPPLCYIVPLSQKTLIVELDNELVFPIIELLMGGTGTAQTAGRELSEIESEIMQMVVSLMARQAETVWKIPDLALEPGSRMKPALMHQSFALTEKATVLKFRVDIAGSSGTFKLVFPTEFLNVLMARIKLDQPVKKTRIWSFPVAAAAGTNSGLRFRHLLGAAGVEGGGARFDCAATGLGAEATSAGEKSRNADGGRARVFRGDSRTQWTTARGATGRPHRCRGMEEELSDHDQRCEEEGRGYLRGRVCRVFGRIAGDGDGRRVVV